MSQGGSKGLGSPRIARSTRFTHSGFSQSFKGCDGSHPPPERDYHYAMSEKIAVMPPVDSLAVDLVSTAPNGAENLGLEYVAAALRAAGHRPRLIGFRWAGQLEAAARAAARRKAPLLGISMLSGTGAIDALAFAYRLRALGYEGHICCGGPFATLSRARLLASHPVIDSVVRHDGEGPMTALASAICQGMGRDDISRREIEALAGTVAGVTTRHGDGPPETAALAAGNRPPERARQRLYAGVPSAKVSAVRGCWGNCSYCGLRALRKEALAEANRCGLDPAEVKHRAIGAMRRRPIESVADEMAQLYHQQGVRFFHFVDENHLPRDPRQAERVIVELDRALQSRRVGRRAVSMMLRADVAIPRVLRALKRLGLVRSLLGVESTTHEGLRALGRGTLPAVSRQAMEGLKKHGVAFHFNILLIRPDSTMESIDREISGLSGVSGGLLDPFQVELFEGTDLFIRMQRTGRVRGGPLLWHYEPANPTAARFARIFQRVRRDAYGFLHMTTYAYEVLGSLAVAKQVGLLRTGRREPRGSIDEDAARLTEQHNELWVQLLEKASLLARRDGSRAEEQGFIDEMQTRSARLILSFRDLEAAINRAASQPLVCEISYPRATSAVAVAIAILGAAACYDSDERSLDGSTPDVRDATSVVADAGNQSLTVIDDAGTCTRGDAYTEAWRVRDQMGIPGDPSTFLCESNPNGSYKFILDKAGRVVDIVDESGAPFPPETTQAYLAAVADQTFPCLLEHDDIWLSCFIALE